ncbi:MAG: hypothetical protein RL094_741 [Candidatus Parcubacteria bacterium]|jgi:predicted metalloenzyme YecM
MQEIKTIQDFYNQSSSLITTFNTFIEKNSLESTVLVDHFCYKCGSSETFESIRKLLESESYFIYQSIISNRRIAVIKLKKGIETTCGTLWFLELSDQKPDNSQINSFDHVEILGNGVSYEELVNSLTEKGENVIETKRPHHTTHDIELSDKFSVKLSRVPLINKIKTEEMM